MVQNVHVRPATPDDLNDIVSLFLASMEEQSHNTPRSTLRDNLLDRFFPEDERLVQSFVLEDDESEVVVGFANVKANGGRNGDEPELDMLFVRSGYGGGKSLVGVLMRYLQQRWGYAHGNGTGLCARVYNGPAVAFYRKYGFESVQEIQTSGDEQALLMRWSGH